MKPLKHLRSVRGFSLTELICAIVIMGVMAAVGYTYMTNAAQAANLNSGNQNAAMLNTAVALLDSTGPSVQGRSGGNGELYQYMGPGQPALVAWAEVGDPAINFYTALSSPVGGSPNNEGGITSMNVTVTAQGMNVENSPDYHVTSVSADGAPVYTFDGAQTTALGAPNPYYVAGAAP